jgi:hypothetical protein
MLKLHPGAEYQAHFVNFGSAMPSLWRKKPPIEIFYSKHELIAEFPVQEEGKHKHKCTPEKLLISGLKFNGRGKCKVL